MSCDGVGLLELLKGLNKENLIGAEIGCGRGGTARYLLENLPNLILNGIDPYEVYVDWNGNNFGQEEHMDYMLSSIDPYKERFNFIRKSSDIVVNDIEDNSLDYIFIDGLHTYEQVLIDCKNYYSKVKSGGIFSGHDYNVIIGVKNAVDEFAKEVNISCVQLTDVDVWYWIKP